MVDITLKVNLDTVIDEMNDLFKKQVPFAAYRAINESVYKGSVDVKKAMPFFIQGGPVPFTARGVQYEKAKSKRDLRASIYIPDAQWKYMRWIVDGGVKRWSKSRHGIGKPIYANTKFNKYGNIPGRKRKESAWREALNRGTGKTLTPLKSGMGKNEFVGTLKRSGQKAIFKREGKTKLKLLMVFSKEASYGKGRFPFQKFAIKYVVKSFPRNFNRMLVDIVNKESKSLKVR